MFILGYDITSAINSNKFYWIHIISNLEIFKICKLNFPWRKAFSENLLENFQPY